MTPEKEYELIQKLEMINEKKYSSFSLNSEKRELFSEVINIFCEDSENKLDKTLLVKNIKDKMDLNDTLYFFAEKCSETEKQKQLFINVLDTIEKEYKISINDSKWQDVHVLNKIIEKQNKEAIEKILPEKLIMSRDDNGRNPFINALYRGDRGIVELVTSRMQTNEELSGHHFYTYNYGNQFETVLAFREVAKKGNIDILEFMIEKGFDLKSKQTLEMLFAIDVYGNRKQEISNFPLESSKFIISKLDHTTNKEIADFNQDDVESWASVRKMRLMHEAEKRSRSEYSIK